MRAETLDLDGCVVDGKAGLCRRSVDCIGNAVVTKFRDRATTATNQKLCAVARPMMGIGFRTADECVKAFNAMHQTMGQQKFERAIDCRRRRTAAFVAKIFQNLISAKWFVAVPHQFQNPAPKRRQPRPTFSAERFRARQGVVQASIVVVAGVEKCF